jgi:hypothetical protein
MIRWRRRRCMSSGHPPPRTQVNTPVFSGVFPVFDPSGSYSVSISRACDGTTLAAAAYSFYYDATDNYGKATVQRSVSVNFGR